MCGSGHRFREGIQDLVPRAAEGGGAGPALRTERQPRGPGKDGAEDTGQSWCRDPQEEGCPGELHLGLAPRLSEAGGPIVPPGDSEQPVLASRHPGSWIRGLVALWELRVFPAPVFWGFFLSRVY